MSSLEEHLGNLKILIGLTQLKATAANGFLFVILSEAKNPMLRAETLRFAQDDKAANCVSPILIHTNQDL